MGAQLDLFGAGAAVPPPPEPARQWVELAERIPAGVKFGTASWTFPGWDMVYRLHYPSKRRFVDESLAEYCRFPLFSSVEIDRSYYSPLSRGVLARYATLLPDGFPCAMKVWSEITTACFPRHPRFGDRAGAMNPHFLDPDLLATVVTKPISEAFESNVGPLVVEIPPPPPGRVDSAMFERRLSRFLSRAPSGYRYAIELRDPRWLTSSYFDILRDYGATHLFNYWSRMPDLADQLAMAGSMPGPFVVVRLVLPPGADYEQEKERLAPFDKLAEPRPVMRRDTLAIVRRALDAGYPTYVYVNNKVEGSSPLTVADLARALADGATR